MRKLWIILFAVLIIGCGFGSAPEPDQEEAAPEQLYTCGMHPQVVEKGAGSCPICGMDLTPMKGPAPKGPKGERQIAHWAAPMDPTYIRDEPGKSPMGMDLIAVYEDELQDDSVVEIAPGVVQQMGVRTAPVERTTVYRHIRTIGEVEVGEDEESVVNLRFSGWVEKIRVDKTGDEVKKGQPLFDIYSPELVSAFEEYLLALRAQGADAPLTRSSRRRLELWDIPEWDIDRVAKDDKVGRTLSIRSPSNGFILHKNVVEGARVVAGKDLYRIGDLRRVWVQAEVYEHDAPWIAEDQKAQMELSNSPGETIEGRVSYVYPTMNKSSRTLPVRLEFDNPGVRLKPGMFATVYIQYRKREGVIAVPTEAIMHSGRRQIVFVALGQGRFVAREITAGLVGDHRMTEVLTGIEEGDRVVVSGQFLIDSESQLQEAIQKIVGSKQGEAVAMDHDHDQVWSCPMHPEILSDGEGKCPECGMFLEERPGTPAEIQEVFHGGEAQQGQFTCPMHPEIIEDEAGRCPKCGMFLEEVSE
jgi:multidrug efflux pump subunit AcrA (membrane-fusion protein)